MEPIGNEREGETSTQLFIPDSSTTSSNKETFLQDSLVILKQMFPRHHSCKILSISQEFVICRSRVIDKSSPSMNHHYYFSKQ